MNKKQLQKQKDLVEKINATYNPGDKLKVKQDSGHIQEWTMKAPASLLGGHTAVIWVNEHPSCYAADRVQFAPPDRVEVFVHFEDNGQDFSYFKISFYPDFGFGTVVEAGPFQNEIWSQYSVISGKPVKGGHLVISKSPQDESLKLKHKIENVIIAGEGKCPNCKKKGKFSEHNEHCDDCVAEAFENEQKELENGEA